MHSFQTVDLSRPGARWPLWPALALLVLAWIALGWPWLSGRVTIPWDAKAHFQPQIQFLAQSLAKGESPFWAPYVFSGHPQIADPQSLIFSPPFLALALVDSAPDLRAADTALLATILLGAAALLLFFRDRGWHWGGALLAAISFAFGASMAWRIQHVGQVLSLAYLPIVVLLLSRALERSSWIYGLAAGLVAGFLVLGRDQVALLAVYFLVGYVLWHLATAERRIESVKASLAPLAAGALGGIVVIAIPVLLTALVAGESNRPAIDLESAGKGSLHPALMITLFAPDVFGSSGRMEDYWGPPSYTWRTSGLFIAQNMGQLYIGAVPVLLTMLALFSGRLLAREIVFFSLAALLVTLYALGWYTPLFALAHTLLPGVDLYRRPADATFLMGFLLAVLAGYAANTLLRDPPSPLPRSAVVGTTIATLAAFATAIALAVYFDRLAAARAPLLVAAGIFLAAALTIRLAIHLEPYRPRAAALLLAAVTVADLAWSNGPGSATALPPSTYAVLQPTTDNETIALLKQKVAAARSETERPRVELVGLGFHWPNASLTHALENTLGYNPLRLGLYTRATGAGDHVGLPDQRQFSPLFPSYRSRLADLLGLRFIATSVPIEAIDKRLAPGDLTLLAKTADGYIYESPRALPRVSFASAARQADFERILASGEWPDFDPARTVLLEGPQLADRGAPAGAARIVTYRNDEVVAEADSQGGGYLVLNDVWHPWWRAEIDGVPAPLLRANVLFRAVPVPPGRHQVRFTFTPLRGALSQLLTRPARPPP